MGNFKEEIAKIRAFVFDVDGVFTDGRILLTPDGQFLREYSVRDGLAVVRAVERGYPIGIISGGHGEQLRQRMEGLGIRHIYTGKERKIDSLHHFSAACGVPLDEMIYMGDDYPDIEPMRAVHLATAPADADAAVKGTVHYVSPFEGGRGCVRDIIEQVLRVRGDWFES
ncbi:MAG: 3-deoxy-D-manno-octulosonate 8-phosphate phosphatase [Rikenella sp.]|nr:3-deoxy-D-manno-octulosonate 8-phosphate phosphatase [Rikenella sp.]